MESPRQFIKLYIIPVKVTNFEFQANASYSVFLSSIAGVILCDYYFVRKGYFSVPDLYSSERSGPYWYLAGINLKAYVHDISP
jgi:cytosine/uracil/thiamine/allantoin permease